MPECNISAFPDERWKPFVGYEKSYAVSTLGRVVCLRIGKLRIGKLLEPQPHYRGRYEDSPSENYLVVLLFKKIGEAPRRFALHKLVLTAFRGPQQPGQRCRHLDGNNLNNELNNLVWSTPQEFLYSSVQGDRLKRALRYDPNTGHFYWKIHAQGRGGAIYPGDIANGVLVKEYVEIECASRRYKASHLAWFFMTGSWPSRSLVVEHRNSNKADNRWANLFAVTNAKNLQNPNDGLRKNNRSGCRGVHLLLTGSWHARITVNRRIIPLGTHANLEQAVAARKEAERLYFTPGHSEALDLKLRAVIGDNYTLRQIPVVRP